MTPATARRMKPAPEPVVLEEVLETEQPPLSPPSSPRPPAPSGRVGFELSPRLPLPSAAFGSELVPVPVVRGAGPVVDGLPWVWWFYRQLLVPAQPPFLQIISRFIA